MTDPIYLTPNQFNPLPHNHDFQKPCIRKLLEILWEKQRQHFPTFSTLSKIKLMILATMNRSSANAFNLD